MTPVDTDEFLAAKARLIERFEDALQRYTERWSAWPEGLVAPVRHVLFGGGKRVRPLLAMLSAEALGGDPGPAIPWAIAVEMIHTYSLAHDDLPAMDDDDERRGRPTCHVAYDEAHAILAGDALLTEAFAALADGGWAADTTVALIGLLAAASGGRGMVGGQILDIGGALETMQAMEHMQRLKTGALIRAAAEGGAIAAGGRPDEVAAIRACGEALGLLFQITDDLLDRLQDPTEDGKNVLDLVDLDGAIDRRDRVAAGALDALAPLGDRAGRLAALVHAVAHRSQ